MKPEQVKTMTPMDRLAYWVTERWNVYVKKESGAAGPWTDDPILSRYRFCNVRRMDDLVSRWLLEHYYLPHRNVSPGTMLVAAALARFFNQPSTLVALDRIRFPWVWDRQRAETLLREKRAKGEKLFNGAYMVRGNDGVDKVATVLEFTLEPIYRDTPYIDTDSMQATWENLVTRYGFGAFMTGQVVADLRWAIPGEWKDRDRWAPVGPGSARGMNRLRERPLKGSIPPDRFVDELGEVIEVLVPKLRKTGVPVQRLEAHDYQNCLCEFDKYERALWGEGKPKQLYLPSQTRGERP